MDIAKVRQAFELVLDSWRKAQALKEKAKAYRLSATGGGIRYDKDHVQVSPEDYQAKWIIKAADCEAQAIKVYEIADAVRQTVFHWMETACSDEEQFVLTQHYLLGKPYAEIKDEYIDLFDYKSKTTMFNVAQRGMKKIAEKM